MRCASFHLLPSQLGVRSQNGVEPLIHLSRVRLEKLSILSVDLKNAFNSIRRDFIYIAIKNQAPELLKPFIWAYRKRSKLFINGKHQLDSSSGVKQGDPLAPLYFSLGYSLIIKELENQLRNSGVTETMPVMSYLDDTYIFSKPEDQQKVHEDVVEVFDRFSEESGLFLKPEKT